MRELYELSFFASCSFSGGSQAARDPCVVLGRTLRAPGRLFDFSTAQGCWHRPCTGGAAGHVAAGNVDLANRQKEPAMEITLSPFSDKKSALESLSDAAYAALHFTSGDVVLNFENVPF